MKILNIIQCTNLGGMEQASLRLMRALQMRGHSFQLISLNPIAGLGPLLSDAGIPTVGLDYARIGRIKIFFQLRRMVAGANADALILTGHNLAATLALSGIGPKRRLYAVHYHHEGVMPDWRWRLVYRLALREFQTITFPSDYVRREAEAIYPPVQAIAETVRNPQEIPPLPSKIHAADLRARCGIPDQAPVVGNAGWLIERKRFDVFLRAAARIHGDRPDIHFLIAGDGDQRSALEAIASELGIFHCTHFIGWQTDLDPFYAAIDVLLFNSDWDCFPTTPVEAMARGIPVVASLAHGGLGEILYERTGWLMDCHDEKALSTSVLEALGPEGSRRGMAGRKQVGEMSDPEKIAKTIELRLLGTNYAKNI